MNTKTITAFLATILLSLGLSAQTTAITNGIINWEGSKITTDSHTGTLDISEGMLTFEADALVGGSFTVDMNSMVCTDLSGKSAARLVGHLKSDDFFGVAEHPEATLVFTSVVPTESGYNITGDFTIRGITNAETFELNVVNNTATADFEIDRSKYNVKFRSGSFFENLGDKLINDELKLSVSFTY
jgi:polyisoprenoid-binding protein YceI